ncbi:Protein of unknown function [Pyronema omphalodes CBS 100304]|uniref:Uncharacterized protein n=1 Tax=Pyronema omphalodes (strain CBS 100304) TaxID=1076935 RepID=U4LUU6_PYROM|nr:Protein of unknown function [Pyronema omphalodes CBS 100304]
MAIIALYALFTADVSARRYYDTLDTRLDASITLHDMAGCYFRLQFINLLCTDLPTN